MHGNLAFSTWILCHRVDAKFSLGSNFYFYSFLPPSLLFVSSPFLSFCDTVGVAQGLLLAGATY